MNKIIKKAALMVLAINGKDFMRKLENAGFSVQRIEPNLTFSESELYRYGISRNGRIFLCTRDTASI